MAAEAEAAEAAAEPSLARLQPHADALYGYFVCARAAVHELLHEENAID